MDLSIVRGTNDKPAASQALVDAFHGLSNVSGELLVGFPVFNGVDGSVSADAIFLSPRHGPVLIDLVEGADPGDYQARQDEIARLLQGRLLSHKELVRRRNLLVEPQTVTFGPALPASMTGVDDDGYLIANSSGLAAAIDALDQADISAQQYQRLVSAIQNISTIRRARRARQTGAENSRADKLQQLEQQIATLDPRQSAAVLETIDGTQRIRGLAGSGKTIVLALKAAYLHAQHPDWTIAVTYHTRSLQDQFRTLITGFVIEQTGEAPDWTRLRVVNAWGGHAEQPPGLYFEFCSAHGIDPYDYRTARAEFGFDGAFDGVCAAALKLVKDPVASYDAILIDEAQDLPVSFLRLARSFLKPPKRLVYAYDELQTLSGAGLPSPEEIFGSDQDGQPLVRLTQSADASEPQRDIVLQKCYRNSGPVLVTAHALGFGVYREVPEGETPLVQMFDQPALWADIGYWTSKGSLQAGREVVLERTEASSPKFLEEHSPIDDLIQFRAFSSRREQDEWVRESVQRNLDEDSLRHDDIMVINPNPISTRDNLGSIRKELALAGVPNHLAGVDTSSNIFFARDRDSVTFTGVFRAKGNEAGMVYVVNAEEGLGSARNQAIVRNRLFTAITRSKAWVRVVGVGPEMTKLVEEFSRIRKERFRLHFSYPTESQREDMRILHRELSSSELSELERRQAAAEELLRALEHGSMFSQDLDRSLRARLRDLLGDAQTD